MSWLQIHTVCWYYIHFAHSFTFTEIRKICLKYVHKADIRFKSVFRRKENPLYGENNNKDIPDTAPLNSENGLVGKELYRRSPVARCLCVGLLLALIISFTALTIVVLSLTGVLTFQTCKYFFCSFYFLAAFYCSWFS